MMSDVNAKAGPAIATTAREVQAIFPTDAALQDAIGRLTQAGFDRADLSLPAASPKVGDATPDQGAAAPTTDTDVRQARTLGTSIAGTVGAFAAAGATIATGGAAGLAIAAAAAIGAGAAGAAHAVGQAADAAQSGTRDAQAARGELVLAVRLTDSGRQSDLERMLREAGASRVEAVERTDGGIDSSGWTGG